MPELTIFRVMEDTSSGVTEGKSQSMEDLSRDDTSEREVKRVFSINFAIWRSAMTAFQRSLPILFAPKSKIGLQS